MNPSRVAISLSVEAVLPAPSVAVLSVPASTSVSSPSRPDAKRRLPQGYRLTGQSARIREYALSLGAVALAGVEHDHLRARLRLHVGLEGLGVGLDGRRGIVVNRDHGRGADQVRRDDGVVAVHRVVAAD